MTFRPYPKPIPKPKKTQKRIRQVSKKRGRENGQYLVLRKVFLENHPICQVDKCKNPATTIHHKKGRIGKLLCDIRHFLAACVDCHQKIELEPEWAKENGYSEDRI